MLTPFDHFMKSVTNWLDSAWYVWIVVAIAVVMIVAAVALKKTRARARRRVPQYRRQLPTR